MWGAEECYVDCLIVSEICHTLHSAVHGLDRQEPAGGAWAWGRCLMRGHVAGAADGAGVVELHGARHVALDDAAAAKVVTRRCHGAARTRVPHGCHTDAQRDGLLQVRTIPRDISAAHTMPLLSVCMDRWITCISFNRWVTEYLVVKELSIAAHRSRSVTLPHRADSFHGTHTCHGTPVISGHGHFNGT